MDFCFADLQSHSYCFIFSLFFILSGCTVREVKKIDATLYPIQEVCIRNNSKVIVSDFLDVITDCFSNHNITATVFDSKMPEQCLYSVDYTARLYWDFTTFLDSARLDVKHKEQTIGSVLFKQNRSSMVKWTGTEAKIKPLMDQLLQDF